MSRSTRSTLAFLFTASLLIASDVCLILTLRDAESNVLSEAADDIVLLHVMYIVFVFTFTIHFAYFRPTEQKQLMYGDYHVDFSVVPSVGRVAGLKDALMCRQIAIAEESLDVNGHGVLIKVSRVSYDLIRFWADDEDEALLNDRNQSDFNVTLRQAVLACMRLSRAKLSHSPRLAYLITASVMLVIALLATLERAVLQRSDKLLFGGTAFGIATHVLTLTVYYLCSVFLTMQLHNCATCFKLRSLVFQSIRELFDMFETPIGLRTETANLSAFITLSKVLRRIGQNMTAQVQTMLSAWLCIWGMMVLIAVLSAVHQTSSVMLDSLMLSTVVSILIIRIIINGADANSQHVITRHALLIHEMWTQEPQMGLLIDVLDNLDVTDAVTVVGFRCTKPMVKTFLVVIFSVLAMIINLLPRTFKIAIG